ncbi:MAG TPA: DUF3849 domain-containing protein, partial [Ruminiclostridium sp.]|nr:DUF3849 domain-containing protein [Ruminiclostridium sp.]
CHDDLQNKRFSAEMSLAEGTITAFIESAIAKYGEYPLEQIIAHTVNYRMNDLRITQKTFDWAKSVELFKHYDNNSSFFPEFISDMRPAILNEMIAVLKGRALPLEKPKKVKGRTI